MVAYFFSGFDPQAGFPSNIAAHLREDVSARDLLLFIASTPSGHEKTDRYAAGTLSWFTQAGIRFENAQVLDDRADPAKAEALLQAASCIYLLGGDTLAQRAFLADYGLVEALQNTNAVVIGLSAGAINMGQTALCSKDDQVPETVVYQGLGIADITVEPHYRPDKAELLAELLPLSRHFPIHALCDGSAVIVRDGRVTTLGEIYRIHHGTMAQISR